LSIDNMIHLLLIDKCKDHISWVVEI